MNRATTLKQGLKMLNIFIKENFTFEDFKKIVDEESSKNISEDTKTYSKAELLLHLFHQQPYYNVEEFFLTFRSYLIYICSNQDGYNAIAHIISASLADISIDVTRRVEIEILEHLNQFITFYFSSSDKFKTKFPEIILNNLYPVELLATMDCFETTEQNILPFSEITILKESANERMSKINYQRKETLRNNLKNFILKHYSKEDLLQFIQDFKEQLNNLNINEYDKQQLLTKYNKQIENLLKQLDKSWNSRKKENPYQLTLFNING